jgi:ferritin-like metal-binding protein YciE
VKRIHGSRGTTEFPHVPGVPFEVRGNELHYPLGLFVDKLEPQNGAYLGRATLLGRELGQFTMRRLDGMGQLKEQLIKHIDEAHAMEQNVLRMLDGMIETTDDEEIKSDLRQHKLETEQHADRMRQRLEARGESPSTVREATGVMGALMKSVVDMVRQEKAGRNARDGYATEHLEIASYQLLERIAERAGDTETAEAARLNRADEEAFAKKIEGNWDRFAELSLKEEGVTA